MRTITMKFGGTSVGSPEAITNVADIVQATANDDTRVVIVVSAMGGTTDMLLDSVRAASKGDRWEFQNLSGKIKDRHEEVLDILLKPSERRELMMETLHGLLTRHLELCQAVTVLGEVTPRILDAVVSLGEQLSSRVVAAVLQERGMRAKQFDATKLILTDAEYQDANPAWERTERRIRDWLLPEIDQGITPVITGFIGSAPDGSTTTLGRGGSDYSAAIFARYTHSDELIIWTDVDGVMTTDPRIDKRAKVLPTVSYAEVGELAFYGAKVLHPKTVQPIIERQTPIRVRNTFNPSAPGTLVMQESEAVNTVIKAVTCVRNVSLLTVGGRGMLGVPGIAGRTFVATAQAGASILMISQSSSEQSFCFTVTEDRAGGVKEAIETELEAEIRSNDVDTVDIQDEVVIITAVGAGMRGTPGIAGRVFTQLGERNLNVISIAQGSSECSISFIVDANDTEAAVKAIHDLALETVEGLNGHPASDIEPPTMEGHE